MGACFSRQRAAAAAAAEAAANNNDDDDDVAASDANPRGRLDSALRLVLPKLSRQDLRAVRLTCRRWRSAAVSNSGAASTTSLTLPLAAASSPALAPALAKAARTFFPEGGARVRLVRAGGWCDPLRARLELQPLVQARPCAVDLSPLAAALSLGAAAAAKPPPPPPLRALSIVDACFTRRPWPLAEIARRFPDLEELEVCWTSALWAPGQLLHEWEALRGLFLPVAPPLARPPAAGAAHAWKKGRRRGGGGRDGGAKTAATEPPALLAPPLPRLRALALRKAAAAHLGHPPLGDSAVAAVATAPGPLPRGLVSLTIEAASLGDAGVRSLALLPGLESLALRGGRLGCSLLALRDALGALTRLTALDLGELAPPEQEVRELAEAAAAAAVVGATEQAGGAGRAGGGGGGGAIEGASVGGNGSGTTAALRFHSAFGRRGSSGDTRGNGVSGTPSHALLLEAGGGDGGGGSNSNSGGGGTGADNNKGGPPSVAALLGADWSQVFRPLVRLRRLSLSADLALLGGLGALRGLADGGGKLCDVRLRAGARFLRAEQRSEARRRRRRRRQQQQQQQAGSSAAPNLVPLLLPPCWLDQGPSPPPLAPGRHPTPSVAPRPSSRCCCCCWRALTSLQVDGVDRDVDAFAAAVAAQLGLRTLVVTGAMRAARRPEGTRRGGGREGGLAAYDGRPGASFARLAALSELRRLEWRPAAGCAPGARPTQAALSHLAAGLPALTTLHLSVISCSSSPSGGGDGNGGGGGRRSSREAIDALGRMASLKHLSLELIELEEDDQEGNQEEEEDAQEGTATTARDGPAARATAPRSPPAAAVVDWRRGLPAGLESLSLARFGHLSPDDWTAAAAACPGLLHLRLVGCCGGGSSSGRATTPLSSAPPLPPRPAAAPLDAHAWRIAQVWPGLLTLVIVKKVLFSSSGGGNGAGQPHHHPQHQHRQQQQQQRGLGSAGVAACARLSRLRALAITLEDGAAPSSSSSSSARARAAAAAAAAPLGEAAPADVRPLALLAPTLEFLLLDSPAGSVGAPPPGARYALRALTRLRLLAMPLLSLHAARAAERRVGLGRHQGAPGGNGGGGGSGGADAALAAAAAAVAAAAALAAAAAGTQTSAPDGSSNKTHHNNALAAIEAALPRCMMVDLPSAPWAVGAAEGGGGAPEAAARWTAATTPEERDWWRAPPAGEAPAWEWRPTFCVLSG